MEQYVIKGGQPLEGEVTIAGAKNAALGILAAAVMTDQEVIIENVPNVRDTRVLLQAIQGIGATVRYIDEHTVSICGAAINPNSDLCVDDEFIRKIRASYYLLGALLGKYKHSQVALPGGCDIGARPINLHIKGFEALGAKVDVGQGKISAKVKKLVANSIYMDIVSVGATINVMLASVLAEGTTTIDNAAKEPHIVDVANFLNSMGADIRGAGTDVIKINGVKELSKEGTYSVVPDQIETGTFMLAAVASKGRPQPQADHNRTVQRDHKLLHIFHSEQNIVCAVCRFFIRDPIIIPEILFCRAKLDCYNLAIRRCTGKQAALFQTASRRDARHCGSMSNFIFFRHQAVRIFQLQRPVDLFPDVFRSI